MSNVATIVIDMLNPYDHEDGEVLAGQVAQQCILYPRSTPTCAGEDACRATRRPRDPELGDAALKTDGAQHARHRRPGDEGVRLGRGAQVGDPQPPRSGRASAIVARPLPLPLTSASARLPFTVTLWTWSSYSSASSSEAFHLRRAVETPR